MKTKVHIDTGSCLGYGDCAALAPHAFKVDDVAEFIGDGSEQDILDAARACPAEAIVVVDAETGKQLHP